MGDAYTNWMAKELAAIGASFNEAEREKAEQIKARIKNPPTAEQKTCLAKIYSYLEELASMDEKEPQHYSPSKIVEHVQEAFFESGAFSSNPTVRDSIIGKFSRIVTEAIEAWRELKKDSLVRPNTEGVMIKLDTLMRDENIAVKERNSKTKC